MSDKLIPLTPDEWEGFTPKQKWDVLSALRGPDVNRSRLIKWFSTSVIRGRMREVIRVGGLVNTDLNLVILPTGMSWVSGDKPLVPYMDEEEQVRPEYEPFFKRIRWHQAQRKWDGHHFFTHTFEAAEILDIPIVTVPSKAYAESMDMTLSEQAVTMLVPHLPDSAAKTLTKHLKKGILL
jgi:hypothetical protein